MPMPAFCWLSWILARLRNQTLFSFAEREIRRLTARPVSATGGALTKYVALPAPFGFFAPRS